MQRKLSYHRPIDNTRAKIKAECVSRWYCSLRVVSPFVLMTGFRAT